MTPPSRSRSCAWNPAAFFFKRGGHSPAFSSLRALYQTDSGKYHNRRAPCVYRTSALDPSRPQWTAGENESAGAPVPVDESTVLSSRTAPGGFVPGCVLPMTGAIALGFCQGAGEGFFPLISRLRSVAMPLMAAKLAAPDLSFPANTQTGALWYSLWGL